MTSGKSSFLPGHQAYMLSCGINAPYLTREQTYDKPTGGIMTVTSELGEPIHKVATRGVKLWGEFDKLVARVIIW